MELSSFRQTQPLPLDSAPLNGAADRMAKQKQDMVEPQEPKPVPTVEEARAAAAAAEAAWRQSAMVAQFSSDPTSAAAALLLASQAAARSAQAQIVYAEARAQIKVAKVS